MWWLGPGRSVAHTVVLRPEARGFSPKNTGSTRPLVVLEADVRPSARAWPRGAQPNGLLFGRRPVWPIQPLVKDDSPRSPPPEKLGLAWGPSVWTVAACPPYPLPGGDRENRPGTRGAAEEGLIGRRFCCCCRQRFGSLLRPVSFSAFASGASLGSGRTDRPSYACLGLACAARAKPEKNPRRNVVSFAAAGGG